MYATYSSIFEEDIEMLQRTRKTISYSKTYRDANLYRINVYLSSYCQTNWKLLRCINNFEKENTKC